MKNIMLALAIVLAALRGSAQSLSIKNLSELWMPVYQFVGEQHPNFTGHKSSELAFLIFQTNDKGHISSFHVKGDPGDSIFNILSRMPLTNFDKWECKTAANKLILVPYFYLFWEMRSYNSQIFEKFFRNTSPEEMIMEWDDVIFIKYMMWYSPEEPPPHCPVAGFELRSDTLMKKPSVTGHH
ncbi:MAG TPA: hypothetical protein VHM26_18960 [Chitinophagaceae bacterium]|jgi:hypothetical protein|nr:hypothetical protein [Chitinophagaceae bacterium]